jgi:hypothetical protein
LPLRLTSHSGKFSFLFLFYSYFITNVNNLKMRKKSNGCPYSGYLLLERADAVLGKAGAAQEENTIRGCRYVAGLHEGDTRDLTERADMETGPVV